MIETIVLDYLSRSIDCPAHLEKPENAPAKWVLIEKTGGGSRNKIKSATIAIQSYADTMYEAALLNAEVEDVMDAIVSTANVSSCRLNSSYNFTDRTKRGYRYQAVFDLVYYD